ncbi:hypothetical protein ACI2K4_20990 [Micromonospora sp. NPDC050397]|uniref:hypothetical protein n=1 Tax=Micromonospora sp. NPDC050397 TaxID=3364279 RepID=UPI00384DAC83
MLTRRTGPLRRILAIGAVATLTLAVGLAGPAAADPGAVCPPNATNCDVWDDLPGEPGTGNPGGGGGNGGTARKCTRNGQPMRCYDEVLGWFNQSDGCYYKLQEPQPEGVPEGMQSYLRSCGGAGGVGDQVPVDLAAPPPGFGAAPDPADLAAEALASINLYGVNVGIAPDPGAGPGLVGLPIWLWAKPGADGFRSTWGPMPGGAADRGVAVWIEANVEKVVWHMGNTARITCLTRGVAYEDAANKTGPPPCGYAGYPKPSGPAKYGVKAVSTWKVTWGVVGGESGEPMYTTRESDTVAIEIDELQVVTR